jgi:hypothetical protein
MPTFTIPVGVVIERKPSSSPWADYVWYAHAVLAEPSTAAPGTSLGKVDDAELFYLGTADLQAHTFETANYRDNFMSGAPRLWVVLRPQGELMPELVTVTCDPTEGEGLSETGWDIVNTVPMPEPIQAALAVFIEEHHVDRAVYKRKRDRADPEALARGLKGPDRDRAMRAAKAQGGSNEQT